MDLQIVREITQTVDGNQVVVEPVTLDEIKNFLRVDHTTDDNEILDVIVSSRRLVEKYIKSDIVPKEYNFYLDEVRNPINLPYAPLNIQRTNGDITNLTVTVEGDVQVEGDGFEILGFDSSNPKIRIGRLTDAFRTFGHRNERLPARRVEINYTTLGMGGGIKQAVKTCAAWLYYGREAKMSTNWKSFASPFRIRGYYGTR